MKCQRTLFYADDISIETLKILYIRYCRLDKQGKILKKVQRYQIYMLIVFFVMELVCTKVLKIKGEVKAADGK